MKDGTLAMKGATLAIKVTTFALKVYYTYHKGGYPRSEGTETQGMRVDFAFVTATLYMLCVIMKVFYQ